MAIVNDVIKKPDEYKAPTTTPVTTEVDAPSETVEGRLNNLTSGGSAYINNSRKSTQRQSNDRGLINSTIAAGAGEDAAIKNALPIAQQDATTYTNTRFKNQDTENEFLKNRQSTDLNMERDSHSSTLKQGEMVLGSELSQGENQQLNDLTMKRDAGLSELTQVEMKTLKDLETKRDLAASENRKSEIGTQADADIKRDAAAAVLNESRDKVLSDLKIAEMNVDSELRTKFEEKLQSDKFSDEAKMNIINTMDNIIRDTNAQITQIGTSDRTAAQQSAAIADARANMNAQLAVYEKLLSAFTDWTWGTDFTPVPDYTVPTPDGGGDNPNGGTYEYNDGQTMDPVPVDGNSNLEQLVEDDAAAAAAIPPPKSWQQQQADQYYNDNIGDQSPH